MGCQDLIEEVPGRTRKEHPASQKTENFNIHQDYFKFL